MVKVADFLIIVLLLIGAVSHFLKIVHLFFGFRFLSRIKAFSSTEESKLLKLCYYILAGGACIYSMYYKLKII